MARRSYYHSNRVGITWRSDFKAILRAVKNGNKKCGRKIKMKKIVKQMISEFFFIIISLLHLEHSKFNFSQRFNLFIFSFHNQFENTKTKQYLNFNYIFDFLYIYFIRKLLIIIK